MVIQSIEHSSCDLEHIFEKCFFGKFGTVLCGNWPEPFFLPAGWPLEKLDFQERLMIESSAIDHRQKALLCYRANYFASALHEVAHWCIAGERRRKLCDFGYWYVPEVRDVESQRKFQSVEIKPQALELLFSLVCYFPFKVSVDNPDLFDGSVQMEKMRGEFLKDIVEQAGAYIESGLPERANHFLQALGDFYRVEVNRDKLRVLLNSYARHLSEKDDGPKSA